MSARAGHGTRGRYAAGCHCRRCRSANTAYKRWRRSEGWRPGRVRVEALSNVDRDGILDRLVSTHGSITSVAKAYVDRYGGELESTRVLLGRIRRRAVRTVVARTWQRLVWLAPDLVEEFLDERAEIEKIAADSPLARRVWLDRKAAELAAAIEAYPSG